MAKAKQLAPIPPGEILIEEFMRPNGISQNRLARDIDINPARVNDIVHGRSTITAAVALAAGEIFRHHARTLDEPAGVVRSAPRPHRRLAQHRAAGAGAGSRIG